MINNERYIDLHLHTKFSDGERSLEETIADAKEAGLSAIAITDHNTFGIDKVMHSGSLEIIPGVEFSTTYVTKSGRKVEVHIVGLFFDGIPPAVKTIFLRIKKHDYVKAVLAKLDSLGIRITLEELQARNKTSNQFGRMQIAELIVEKGFASDKSDAMDRWIGNFSPYYLNPMDYMNYIDMEECVRLICENGGLPVLAHPFHYKFTKEEIEEMIVKFRNVTEHPLAIEVYYGKYTEDEVHYLEMMSDKYHLLRSASSDRHRKEQPFVRGDYALLDEMKKAMI